jgi:hypothetical protein
MGLLIGNKRIHNLFCERPDYVAHDEENTVYLAKKLIEVCQRLGKGKTIPLQAWSVPEGSRKLRFPDYVTTAQDGGKVVSLTHRPPLPPENVPGTHFC